MTCLFLFRNITQRYNCHGTDLVLFAFEFNKIIDFAKRIEISGKSGYNMVIQNIGENYVQRISSRNRFCQN